MPQIYDASHMSLQQAFPEYSVERIRRLFDVDVTDSISEAVWLNAFYKKGFVMTENALLWRLGEKNNASCGKILKSDLDSDTLFLLEKVLAEVAGLNAVETGSDCVYKFSIKSEKTEAVFFFKGNIEEKQAETLKDVLKFALLSDDVPQIDLGSVLPATKNIDLMNIADAVMFFFSSITDKVRKTFASLAEYAKSSRKERAEHKRSKANTASTKVPPASKNKDKPKSSGARIFFSHFFDFIASLAFVVAVVVAVKPELLAGVPMERSVFVFSEKIGELVFNIDLVLGAEMPAELVSARNLWVTLLLALFVLLKLAVIFISKSSNKLVAFLMIVLALIASCVVADKFLLFVLICLLLYISFQLLCGFESQAMRCKLLLLFLTASTAYLVANFLIMPDVKAAFGALGDAFIAVFKRLSIPVVWW